MSATAKVYTFPMAPGYSVRHCGHPTALRPYYVDGPAITQRFTWGRLEQARDYARAVSSFGEAAAQRLFGIGAA